MDELALADAVGGVAEDGEVGELFEDGDGGDVHGVAGVGFEGADAALAEDEVVVAAGEDVLGGEEDFLDGGGDAALHEDGLADVAELAEEVEVLHVARADLEAVDVGEHGLDLGDLHDFGDDEEAGLVGDFAEELEAFEAHALEAVGGGAGLVGSAAEELAAGLGDLAGAGEDLVAGLSTEQGPAMTVTSVPPTTTPLGKVTVVPSGRKLRPASLYWEEMR